MSNIGEDEPEPRDDRSAWESGIDGPAPDDAQSTGGETGTGAAERGLRREVPTADPPGASTDAGATADERLAAVPDPAALPPETDPTGADWWRVLSVLTGVAVAGFFLWPLLSPVLTLGEMTAGTRFESAGALFALAPLLLLFLVRFVALPVALWRDASLLRQADADWEPSRGFYMTAGMLWASLTCADYLYKRSRYTGRPALPISDDLLYFTDRRVASNWHLVVGAAVLLLPLSAGFEALFVAAERVPGGDVAGAVLAMVFLCLLAAGFVFLPVAYYRDCRAVRRSDADWEPTTWFYVVVGYVFTLPVGAYYLYKRSQIESLAPSGRR